MNWNLPPEINVSKLRDKLGNQATAKEVQDELNEMGGELVATSGSGPPSSNATSIPAFYLDTNDNQWYMSFQTGQGAADWEPVITSKTPLGFLTLGDENYSLIAGTTPRHIVFATPLTEDRTVTLTTTNQKVGAEYIITRKASATGNFDLSIGALAVVSIGWSVRVVFDGTEFILA